MTDDDARDMIEDPYDPAASKLPRARREVLGLDYFTLTLVTAGEGSTTSLREYTKTR